MKLKFLTGFIFYIFMIAKGESIEFETSMDSAICYIHNMEYIKSLEIFNKIIENDDHAMFSHLGKLQVERMLLIESKGYNFDKEELFQKTNSVIKLLKTKLKQDPENFESNFCLSMAIGFKLRIVLGEKNSLYIIFNGLKAIKYIRISTKLPGNNPDAEFCRGVYEYYVAQYPAIIRYLSKSLLNNSGNIETAKKRMHQAADFGKYLKYDAWYTLAFMYLYVENNPKLALHYINSMISKFPDNPGYQFLYCFASIRLNNMEAVKDALMQYKSMLDNNNLYFEKFFRKRLMLLEGMLASQNKDYQQAIKHIDDFIKDYDLELEHLLAIAFLEKGKILDIMGDRIQAREQYKKVLKIDNRTYPVKLARKYKKEGFNLDNFNK